MAATWEYARFRWRVDQSFLFFTHDQKEGLIDIAKEYFEKALKERESHSSFLMFEENRVSESAVLRFLSYLDWELVAARETDLYFKRRIEAEAE